MPLIPDTTREARKVIVASSLGTVFEWYDFYLYGSLASIISKQFFAGVNETTAFIFALLAFAAGFAVRPFGAAVFGRIGSRPMNKKEREAFYLRNGTVYRVNDQATGYTEAK